MGYVGRIVSTLIIWLVSFTWIAWFSGAAESILKGKAEAALAIVILAIFSFIGWQLGKQYDKAKYYSEKDELTGTYNRRYMNQKIFNKLSSETKKNQQLLCLFLFDIDELKEINDTYGHLDGDGVIRQTALLLNRHARKTDIVARWGGDEFIMAAPNTNAEEAEKILVRIEQAASSCSLEGDRTLQLSAGYALYPEDGSTLQELMQKADERMYARKKEMKKTGKPRECDIITVQK